MTLETLAKELQPRQPRTYDFDVAEGRAMLDDGRKIHRVSFLSNPGDKGKAVPLLYDALKRFVSKFVDDLTKQYAAMASGSRIEQPFATLPLIETPTEGKKIPPQYQQYLDMVSMFPSFPKLKFERFLQDSMEAQNLITATYRNSIANEPNVQDASQKKILYLTRLSLLGAMMPNIIKSVLAEKGIPESEEMHFINRALASFIGVNMLKKGVWENPAFSTEFNSVLGEDRYPYLNASANEFTLTGMHPTAAALKDLLSKPNPYGLTHGILKKIENTLPRLLNLGTEYASKMSNPQNIEQILADAEVIKQIRTAMFADPNDATALISQSEGSKASSEYVRRALAMGYTPELVELLSKPASIEALLKADKKERIRIYDKAKLRDDTRQGFDSAATNTANAGNSDMQAAALKTMLKNYGALMDIIATYKEISKMTDPERGDIDFLVPDHGKTSGISQLFTQSNAYVFSEKGQVFVGEGSSSEAGPGIIVADSKPIVAVIDVRGFTDLCEKHGEDSFGVYLLEKFEELEVPVKIAKGSIPSRPGDAFIATFEGKNAALRYLSAAAAIPGLLDKINDEAERKGEFPLELGIAAHAGKIVSRTGLYSSPTENTGSRYISRAMNWTSRLTSTAYPDVAKALQSSIYLPLDTESLSRLEDLLKLNPKLAEELVNQAKRRDAGQFQRFLQRKDDKYQRSILVLDDGSFHNKGNIVTEPVMQRLRTEGAIKNATIKIDDHDELFKCNNYFDPEKRQNLTLPDSAFTEHFEIEYFNDPLQSGRIWAVSRVPTAVKLKGIPERVPIYEILPPESLVYTRPELQKPSTT